MPCAILGRAASSAALLQPHQRRRELLAGKTTASASCQVADSCPEFPPTTRTMDAVKSWAKKKNLVSNTSSLHT